MATKTKAYVIRKRGDEWCVMDEAETKTLGCHDSEEKAQAQLRAIEANKHALEDLVEFEHEVFKAGTWNDDPYTAEDLDAMVAAFGEVGFVPPVKVGHDDRPDAPAYGIITALRRAGEALFAKFRVPRSVAEAIKNLHFPQLSCEILWNLDRNGTTFPKVLGAVSLLGGQVPAVDLRPVFESVLLSVGKPAGAHAYTVDLVEPHTITVTVEQMATICPPCAEKMKAAKFKAIKLESKDGGKTYAFPGGMSPEAMKGMCEHFSPDEGFRTRCMDSSAAAEVSDPGAFCNALKTACSEQGMMQVKPTPRTAKEAAMSKPETPIAVNTALDTLIKEFGLEADRDALKKRLVGADFVPKDEHEALKTQMSERDKKEQEAAEVRRQERIESKVSTTMPPALRPYLRVLYDIATKETRKVTFAAADGASSERLLEEVLDEMRVFIDRSVRSMFGEVAFTEVKRAEAPMTDPRAEVDRQIKAYCEANKMNAKDPDDYIKARAAVFEANPELKQAYAKS